MFFIYFENINIPIVSSICQKIPRTVGNIEE